jgi:N-acetylmuramoyl-L-alanine amidase
VALQFERRNKKMFNIFFKRTFLYKSFLSVWLPVFLFMTLASYSNAIPQEEIVNASKRLVFFKNDAEFALVDRSLPIITNEEQPGRDEILNKAQIIMDLILTGPTASEKSDGIFSVFPQGTRLDHIEWDGKGGLSFYFHFPREFLSSPGNVCGMLDSMYQQIVKSFESLAIVNGFNIMAYDEMRGDYHSISEFAMPEEQKESIKSSQINTRAMAQPAVYNVSRRRGSLTGKTVYVWPGHGYTISGTGWGTQRPNCWNYCEDYGDIETTAFYLARYCYNAGAFVVMNRERDFNPNMVIIDNEVTTSTAGMFISNGFVPGTPYPSTDYEYYYYSYSSSVSYPLTGNNRPFMYGGYDHVSIASDIPSATATWIPDIPADGYYSVYVSYGQGRYYWDNNPASNYTTDAHYVVKHGGGATEFRVNQQYHICTWVFLGEFYFYKGMNPEKGAVILDNQSNHSVGQTVSADAVRFGGGMGNVARNVHISGLRRWEEATKYYGQFGGAPKCIFNYGTGDEVTCDNGIYAWWPDSLHQNGEDGVTIMFHTNGSGAYGTETFVDPTVANSTLLQNKVHDEIIGDIRQGYYPSWTNRRKATRTYPSELPRILVELAFHDTLYPDNTFLHDPKFRQLSSRAIYQGTVKYFAEKDGTTVHLLPEPPLSFVARNTTTGIKLNWLPPETDTIGLVGDAATSYVVYLSFDGRAWDNGIETVNTEFTFTGLISDKTYFFRVTAVNDGGESFPTKTLAARVAPSGSAPILIIDNYDRLDRYCQVTRTGMPSIGTIYSMELPRMNNYDNVIRHAEALEHCTMYFDSADKSSVEDGLVDINNYKLVDWLMGRQGERVTDDNSIDFTFDDTLRSRVQTFLANGKSLFVSGTDIGFDLDSNSDQSDVGSIFFNNYLKADYISDDAATYVIKGSPGSIFDNIPSFNLDNGDEGIYNASSPDIIGAYYGSQSAMSDDAGSKVMGIQYLGEYRLIYFSFPFETIVDSAVRNEIMYRIVTALMPTNAQSHWLLYQ